MNTQVKVRLTGAVILVALVVLLVPELLTGPSHGTPMVAGNAEQMPLRSYTIDLAGGGEQKQASPVTLEQTKPAPAMTAAPGEPALQAHAAACATGASAATQGTCRAGIAGSRRHRQRRHPRKRPRRRWGGRYSWAAS